MQWGVAPAGRYSARNVGGHAPSNASASPVAAVNSPNEAISRAMLESPHTTAQGPASFTT